jgi:hypothetical protein
LPWMKELQALLLDWQQGSGMWSYPSGATDLSITQYAALGLWSAKSCKRFAFLPRRLPEFSEAVSSHREVIRACSRIFIPPRRNSNWFDDGCRRCRGLPL